MNKVSISDFIIAIFDLMEAEGKALSENTTAFMQKHQRSFKRTISQSGWMIGFIFIAVICILGAVVFFIYGCYEIFSTLLPNFAASFVIAVLFLILAGIFSYVALLKMKNEDK